MVGLQVSFGKMPAAVHRSGVINTVTAPPWGNKVALISVNLANPYANYAGGNPFPVVFNKNTPFSSFGTYNTWDYNTKPTYVEAWNLLSRCLTQR